MNLQVTWRLGFFVDYFEDARVGGGERGRHVLVGGEQPPVDRVQTHLLLGVRLSLDGDFSRLFPAGSGVLHREQSWAAK